MLPSWMPAQASETAFGPLGCFASGTRHASRRLGMQISSAASVGGIFEQAVGRRAVTAVNELTVQELESLSD